MNCKPGDIARIVHPSMYGTLVDILHAAPVGNYRLPDGQTGFGDEPGCWVFKFLGQPKDVPMYNGFKDFIGTRKAQYAACHDRWLRPIRDPGDDAVDETIVRLGKPVPDEVTA
tara:strand:- start:766 stop:1104 length:339 start_codon:yes stop_codon:yes gene_type:complete